MLLKLMMCESLYYELFCLLKEAKRGKQSEDLLNG